MRHKLYIWAISLLLLAACSEQPVLPTIGEAVPAFTLKRVDGSEAHFPDDFKGKVVAIQFWADWCPACISEMVLLAPVYEKYKSRGLVILAVNMRQDKATVAKWIAQLNSPYDFLLDINGEAALAYDVSALPTSFIVDRKGLLSTRILGESTAETFEEIIQSIL